MNASVLVMIGKHIFERFDWVDPLIKKLDISEKEVKVKIESQTIHINRSVDEKEARSYLKDVGLRPASFEEFIGFCGNIPDYLDYPIITLLERPIGELDLRSFSRDGHVRFSGSEILYTDKIGDTRRLGIARYKGRFDPIVRFLAMRE